MTNTITEAAKEALRKEKDRRTVERIAELLVEMGMCAVNRGDCLDDCYEHWLEVLEPSQ